MKARFLFCYCAVVCTLIPINVMTAAAERASLVIDADSGAVLHARNARLSSYPASLTKLMTVYLVYEAIDKKVVTIGDLTSDVRQGVKNGPNKKAIADICITGAGLPAFTRASGWGLVLGVRKKEKDALLLSRQIKQQSYKTLRSGRSVSIPFLRGVLLYRACITNLIQDKATEACQQLRKQNQYCIVASPNLVKTYVAKDRLALERSLASFYPE